MILRAIDSAIKGVGTQQLLMTCFAALIDPAHGTVEYSNAGHNFPYLLQTGATGEVRDIAVLALRGSPLGNIPGDFLLQSGKRTLTPGDVFVFFTDGMNEAMAPGQKEFGMEHLRKRLLAQGDGPSSDFVRDLGSQIDLHAGGGEQSDDITIVSGRRLP